MGIRTAGPGRLAASGTALAAKDVVVAVGYQPETLTRTTPTTRSRTAVTKSFYEGLFQFDKDLKVQNVLAESYDVSKDGLVYTIKLRSRRQVPRRHRLQRRGREGQFRPRHQPGQQAQALQPSSMAKTEAVDATTVRITLKEPFSPFINTLAHPRP
jgi:glutathione transport system substrate-binding protein